MDTVPMAHMALPMGNARLGRRNKEWVALMRELDKLARSQRRAVAAQLAVRGHSLASVETTEGASGVRPDLQCIDGHAACTAANEEEMVRPDSRLARWRVTHRGLPPSGRLAADGVLLAPPVSGDAQDHPGMNPDWDCQERGDVLPAIRKRATQATRGWQWRRKGVSIISQCD